MSREVEKMNRRLLRARDAMDRAYAEPLNVRAVAAVAHISPAHFSRSFRGVFGETPHRYLQRRRVERAMFLLRETDRSVTDVCFDVAFTSLGTFSRTFREILSETPSGSCRAHARYGTLRERGVADFTQDPTEHFYGTDMGVRDPFGNPIRILQQGKAKQKATA